MIEILSREAIYLWHYFMIQFGQIFWYWVVGILIGSVISVFGKEKIHRLLIGLQNKKLGVFGIVPACLIGIASPLCLYGTIPISASFSEKGVADDWLAAFMMSSILLNPQLIIYSAALGQAAFITRIVTGFLCGCSAGLLIRFFYKNKGKTFFNFSGFAALTNRDIDPSLLIRLIKNIGRNIRITGPYFLLGVVLSALFQRYFPESLMIMLFGNNKPFGVLMAASVGVPLYACGGGTIPLLKWWLAGGMSIGAASAFMLSGQAAKITNLSAIKIVLGAKRFGLYLIFILTFAFLSGLVANLITFL